MRISNLNMQKLFAKWADQKRDRVTCSKNGSQLFHCYSQDFCYSVITAEEILIYFHALATKVPTINCQHQRSENRRWAVKVIEAMFGIVKELSSSTMWERFKLSQVYIMNRHWKLETKLKGTTTHGWAPKKPFFVTTTHQLIIFQFVWLSPTLQIWLPRTIICFPI